MAPGFARIAFAVALQVHSQHVYATSPGRKSKKHDGGQTSLSTSNKRSSLHLASHLRLSTPSEPTSNPGSASLSPNHLPKDTQAKPTTKNNSKQNGPSGAVTMAFASIPKKQEGETTELSSSLCATTKWQMSPHQASQTHQRQRRPHHPGHWA